VEISSEEGSLLFFGKGPYSSPLFVRLPRRPMRPLLSLQPFQAHLFPWILGLRVLVSGSVDRPSPPFPGVVDVRLFCFSIFLGEPPALKSRFQNFALLLFWLLAVRDSFWNDTLPSVRFFSLLEGVRRPSRTSSLCCLGRNPPTGGDAPFRRKVSILSLCGAFHGRRVAPVFFSILDGCRTVLFRTC